VPDWEGEYAMALANKFYGVETLFLPASSEVAFISSSLIKEAWSYGVTLVSGFLRMCRKLLNITGLNHASLYNKLEVLTNASEEFNL